MNSIESKNPRLGLIAAIVTASSWSVLAIVLKYALQFSDSYTIVWYRMCVAFVFLSAWFVFKGRSQKLKVLFAPPGLLLISAFCLSANYVGFMEGVHYTSPATTQIFIQFGPLSLALSGLFIFNERLSRAQLYGLLLCALGFSLFFWDRLDKLGANTGHYYWGLMVIVAAALIWGVFASLQKYLLDFWESPQINVYIYSVATLAFLPFVDWSSLIELPLWGHVLFTVLGLNTILAYGFLSVALRNLPASLVSPILIMNPLVTLLLIAVIEAMNWNFIPADPIGLWGYVGAVTAVLGVVFVVTRGQKAS